MSYFSQDIVDIEAIPGDIIEVKHPSVAFISVISSDSRQRGGFKISYTFLDISTPATFFDADLD